MERKEKPYTVGRQPEITTITNITNKDDDYGDGSVGRLLSHGRQKEICLEDAYREGRQRPMGRLSLKISSWTSRLTMTFSFKM